MLMIRAETLVRMLQGQSTIPNQGISDLKHIDLALRAVGLILLILSHSGQQVYSERFTTHYRARHINVKEMAGILHALQRWLANVKESHWILHWDNFAVATGMKKISISGNGIPTIGAIAMFAAGNNTEIESLWASPRYNATADMQSRGKMQKIADRYSNQGDADFGIISICCSFRCFPITINQNLTVVHALLVLL